MIRDGLSIERQKKGLYFVVLIILSVMYVLSTIININKDFLSNLNLFNGILIFLGITTIFLVNLLRVYLNNTKLKSLKKELYNYKGKTIKIDGRPITIYQYLYIKIFFLIHLALYISSAIILLNILLYLKTDYFITPAISSIVSNFILYSSLFFLYYLLHLINEIYGFLENLNT